MLSDTEILQRLLADERLTEQEEGAFRDMLRRGRALTPAQRQWADSVFTRLELDADEALNLFSLGKVPVGNPVLTPDVLRKLPLKPPGRR